MPISNKLVKSRQAAVKQSEVYRVCNKLYKEASEDSYPKLDDVCRIIGRGSRTTIITYWKQWKDKIELQKTMPPVPNEFDDLMKDSWYLALDNATSILDVRSKGLEKQLDQSNSELEEKELIIEEIEDEKSSLVEKIAQINSELSRISDKYTEEREKRIESETGAKATQTQLANQIADLKKELEKSNLNRKETEIESNNKVEKIKQETEKQVNIYRAELNQSLTEKDKYADKLQDLINSHESTISDLRKTREADINRWEVERNQLLDIIRSQESNMQNIEKSLSLSNRENLNLKNDIQSQLNKLLQLEKENGDLREFNAELTGKLALKTEELKSKRKERKIKT